MQVVPPALGAEAVTARHLGGVVCGRPHQVAAHLAERRLLRQLLVDDEGVLGEDLGPQALVLQLLLVERGGRYGHGLQLLSTANRDVTFHSYSIVVVYILVPEHDREDLFRFFLKGESSFCKISLPLVVGQAAKRTDNKSKTLRAGRFGHTVHTVLRPGSK